MSTLTPVLPDSGTYSPVDDLAAFLDAWRNAGGGLVVADAGGVALRTPVLGAVLAIAASGGDLEDLQLPLRFYNALRQNGVHTIGQLAARTREQLLGFRNIGVAGVAAMDEALAGRGLHLAEHAAAPGVAYSGTPGLPVDVDGFVIAACWVCGCTEDAACPGGCWWVPDPWMEGDLCSACLPPSPAPSAEQWHRRAVDAARAWLAMCGIDTDGPVREAMDQHYGGGWNQFLTDNGVPLGL